jgi:ankyrin repeat protein
MISMQCILRLLLIRQAPTSSELLACVELAQVLIKAGVNPNDPWEDYSLLLWSAICDRDKEMVKLLIEYGA